MLMKILDPGLDPFIFFFDLKSNLNRLGFKILDPDVKYRGESEVCPIRS